MICYKRHALGVLFVLVCCFSSYSQRTCATNEQMMEQFANDPSIKENVDHARTQARNWLEENASSNNKSGKAIITIPIVVHVVYNNESENISDAQILSQIDILNEDYRMINADTSSIPNYFKGIAADCEIEFCLAKIDPQGNPTSGITRTETSVTSFASTDPKSNATGGKDPWPKDDYLNFWVCDLGSGLLGFATFPGGSPGKDGVVCTYTSVGRPPDNPFSAPFNLGRTATHEIGHWLGLSHTFENGCKGTSQSNCKTQGDRICDTPPTSSANYGCPSSTKNSCTETPLDKNDMHQNYMDYVNDACMYLFTNDQKDAMLSVLNTSRLSLQSSEVCALLKDIDAGITQQVPMDTICGTDAFIPAVTLNNYGNDTLTTAIVKYQLDLGTVMNYSWTGSIPSLNSQIIYLPKILVDIGSHTFTSWSDLPNGGIDNLPENDTSQTTFEFASGNSVMVNIVTGDFTPAESVSWNIQNSQGNIVASNSGYLKNSNNIESVCLAPGCHVFTINDPNSNAIGTFSLVDTWGDTLIYQNDIYNYMMTFCISLPPYLSFRNKINDPDLLIFPNPTNGIIQITYPEQEFLKAKVYNILGMEMGNGLKSITHSGGIIKMNLSALDPGIYYIELHTQSGLISRKISLIK